MLTIKIIGKKQKELTKKIGFEQNVLTNKIYTVEVLLINWFKIAITIFSFNFKRFSCFSIKMS